MKGEFGGIKLNPKIREQIAFAVKDFSLPRYCEIPDVGLYLEQTTKYIADCLAPLTDASITGSMISNYVKRGLVSNPVKKQYDREQIAYLIYIAVVKNVLCMDDIRLMIKIQRRTYTSQMAYDYFCSELENVLGYIFGNKSTLDTVGETNSDEKVMLRNTIMTVAHKIYLDKLFAQIQKMEKDEEVQKQ